VEAPVATPVVVAPLLADGVAHHTRRAAAAAAADAPVAQTAHTVEGGGSPATDALATPVKVQAAPPLPVPKTRKEVVQAPSPRLTRSSTAKPPRTLRSHRR
jgi:hypothetical protein